MPRIVEYIISNGMNAEGELFRVKKDWVVRFVPDVSLVGLNIRFFINYPGPGSDTFDRSAYRELQFINPTISKKEVDCFDNYFELSSLSVSGSFRFYFSTDGSAPAPPSDGISNNSIAGSGYITVDPHFRGKFGGSGSPDDERDWDLDGVVLQSYVSKYLGPFDEWESRLATAFEGKYNMIHFTPMQELGYSHSAYSIRDQLKVNPNFTPKNSSKPLDWDDIEKYIRHLENDYSVLSMADLVFNHTSNDSPWLHEHPECGYNVVNSPHLVAAYILDTIVWQLSLQAGSGALSNRGINPRPSNPDTELPAMRSWLWEQIDRARLYEFFMADVVAVQGEFVDWLLSGKSSIEAVSFVSDSDRLALAIAGRRRGRRFGATVDFKLARKEFVGVRDHSMPLTEAAARAAADRLKVRLEELNGQKRAEIDEHLRVAVENVIANARYHFFDSNGPKWGTITRKTPIMSRYFYHPVKDVKTVEEAERVLDTKDASRIMAFNGWVMNFNPLDNFAELPSFVYLRRELIVWGDSVKLRYGKSPNDCPYLWERMAQYSALTARIFHAVRLDNCHSTPLPVAQYMLEKARAVRPNLYVVAELFTGSEYVDNVFINKLSLNSLIRETLASWSGRDLGSSLYRYGVNRPAGAFFEQFGSRRLYPAVAHALLYDQTHDNQSVAEKHCFFDYLPLAALCSACCCAIGSTRGYEELVPHNIDVVKETRMYAKWPEQVNPTVGLVEAKSLLNELHTWLSFQSFTETYVDQVTDNVIAVTRICPQTRESVVVVCHTAFSYDQAVRGHVDFRPIEVGGQVNRLLYEMRTIQASHDRPDSQFKKNSVFINGLQGVRFSILSNADPKESKMFRVDRPTGGRGASADRLTFHYFPPGSVVIVSVRLAKEQEKAVAELHDLLYNQFGCSLRRTRKSVSIGKGEKAYMPRELPTDTGLLDPNVLRMQITGLRLIDLNQALFRCKAEGLACEPQCGAYDVPGYGELCYLGFESIAAVMSEIRNKNDLGHAICGNLRNGEWLAHFLVDRLCVIPKHADTVFSPSLVDVGKTLKILFSPLANLPRYLVPAFFDVLVGNVTNLLHGEVVLQMEPWIRTTSSLVKRLAVATNQFYGFVGNCRLPNALPFQPSETKTQETINTDSSVYCSLSAGLPHFSEGMWRCWGRDTFISLRGCLLLTGRYQEAAQIILSYAGLLRHGLIPNLTGEGQNVQPRYNCRDAVWYWLYAIVCYERAVAKRDSGNRQASAASHPDSIDVSGKVADTPTSSRLNWAMNPTTAGSLMERPVWRWFTTDDAPGWPYEKPERRSSVINMRVQVFHEIMQEALQRHFSGIDFVERNAGPEIDEHMRPEGFHVTACVDTKTGFPRGGNAFNCGTWMDKMGSSGKAGNRGVPATPRDGAAVELVGLAYAVASWLHEAHRTSTPDGQVCYPHSGVQEPDGKFITWHDWMTKLKSNFEPAFWIADNTTDKSLAYNRGIYRDSVGSSSSFTDNQLRPNFLVTMVVAPELFTPHRAHRALEIVRERLVGPIGIRTLGNNDMAYRGDYDNSNDSTDFAVAKGFNYHQGPEWVWPTGYYLRARLLFARILARESGSSSMYILKDAIRECQQILARLDAAILSTPWRSLPELTNSNGKICYDSCPAQAWSVGCAMEAVYDLMSTRL